MTSVYTRLAIYILSMVLGSIPATALGWCSYEMVDGTIHLSLQVEGAVTALLAAVGISGGVFKKWGTQ